MYCLKYAPNGRNSIGGKLADVTQNCQSFQRISLLEVLKFFAVFIALRSSIFNNGIKYSKKFEKSQKRDQFE